jgi:polyferredoxin
MEIRMQKSECRSREYGSANDGRLQQQEDCPPYAHHGFGFRFLVFLRTSDFGPLCAALAKRGLRTWRTVLLLLTILPALSALAAPRFPPPDFVETNHQLPTTTTPEPRLVWIQYLDVVVLAGALGTATWLIYRKRSRRGLFWLGLFSIGYFGFWRKGCVCAIGSPQNISLGLFDSGYAVPLAVIAFFALPLVFTLFFGRTFCSGVCPHGALQDLLLIKPLKVPFWLEQGLSVVPFIFLGAGVWLAASGAIFLFCHYDPIVPVFRLNGRGLMVITGVAILLLATVVGRPYCRFLCPYGALLKMASTVSRRRVRVTPDLCTQCRLCEHSCPFGAMREPESGIAHPLVLARERRRLGWFIVTLPVLIFLGALVGGQLGQAAARLHPQVALAEEYALEPESARKVGPLTPDELALRRAQQNPEPILQAGLALRGKVETGGWWFGAWVGLVIGAKLISLSLRRTRPDYEPDHGACYACARCFESCPQELVRRGVAPPEPIPAAEGGNP